MKTTIFIVDFMPYYHRGQHNSMVEILGLKRLSQQVNTFPTIFYSSSSSSSTTRLLLSYSTSWLVC
jgi:hypothetical protein